MNLSIQIEPKDAYLLVVVTGDFEIGKAKELSLQFLEACVTHKLSKVLIDIRPIQGNLTVMERWDYAIFMANQYLEHQIAGRLNNLRLAYLGIQPVIDPKKLAETIAVNRGLNLKATTDLAEAFAWLGLEPDID